MSPGVNHTCGVTFEDRVLCWGFNFSGELGNGGHDLLEHNTPAPVQIVGLLFRQVSAGGSFYQDARDPFLTNRGYTCALTTEAHAYCWGDNKFGQLGDGTGTDRSVPTAVWGNRRFRQISAGPKHVCAVKYSGAAYCWGRNPFGDLGDGTSELQRVRSRWPTVYGDQRGRPAQLRRDRQWQPLLLGEQRERPARRRHYY